MVTHPLHEAAEGLVELDAELALALLLAQLVRVVVGAVAAFQRLRRRDDLGEELQVLELRTCGCAGSMQREVQAGNMRVVVEALSGASTQLL